MRTTCFFILLTLAASAWSQEADSIPPERKGLAQLMEYLNLRPDDISFRPDYTEPDSFRLKIVSDLMKSPLGMLDYTASLRNAHAQRQPEVLAGYLFRDLAREHQTKRSGPYHAAAAELERRYDLYFKTLELNQLLSRAATYLEVIFPRSTELMLGKLSAKERRFLRNEFKELIVTHLEEELMSVTQLDSIEKAEEVYCDSFAAFGTKIDVDPVIAAGIDCLRELMPEIDQLREKAGSDSGGIQSLLKAAAFLPSNAGTQSYLGKQKGWAVGGTGPDVYRGDYSFILDLGGDDRYELTGDPDKPHGCIIIDFGGDDDYRAESDFAVASSAFSVGLLLDFGGDDQYEGKSFALGSGFFGFGLLYDAGGNDHYSGDTHCQGAATFGLGILIDEGGNDRYDAALCSQGFGSVEGIGLIYESAGTDAYYAGGKYKDILRYEDRYLSESQGFGSGFRPTISGGIGAIIDLAGNDSYYSDIFAQGTSYWWSFGMLYDSSGNDTYHSYQYAQGAATHMTLGVLVDDNGKDMYVGKGLMQGCGHDYACGILLDRHGNDTYLAYDLSQGAGSANGAGLLIDNEGDDRYLAKNAKNTQGFGDSRRDFGSIGLLIDQRGIDQYLGNGRDDFFWRTDSKWGGGLDVNSKAADSGKTGK